MPIINPYKKSAASSNTQPINHAQNHNLPAHVELKTHQQQPLTGHAEQRFAAAATKKNLSFKAQLKQQLQDLKRRKKLEAERKLMEDRIKKKEAERLLKEEEEKRIRQEYEMKKEEERKRKEEERRLEAEKRREREEKKALVRKAAALKRLAKEERKQQMARQKEIDFQRNLLSFQQRQSMLYGLVPGDCRHLLSSHPCVVAPLIHPTFTTPCTQSREPNVMMSADSSGVLTASNVQSPYPFSSPSEASNPMQIQQQQTIPHSFAFAGAEILSPLNPLPHLQSTFHAFPVLSNHLHHPVTPSSDDLRPKRWPSTPAPIIRPPLPPKVLSENPLQSPSPFALDYEILPHVIVIVKECGKNSTFGVSVEAKTQSVLVDRDVWESLKMNKKTIAHFDLSAPVGKPGNGTDHGANNTGVPSCSHEVSPSLKGNESLEYAFVGEEDKGKRASHNDFVDLRAPISPLKLTSVTKIMEEAVLGSDSQSTEVQIEVAQDVDEIDNRIMADPSIQGKAIEIETVPGNDQGSSHNAVSPPLGKICSLSSNSLIQDDTISVKPATRKRRKRAFFHVMSVMDASAQNAKTSETDQEKQLKPGDLILEIQNVKTSGLPFFQACHLFASCNLSVPPAAEDDEATKLIECSLVVARRKPRPLPKPHTNKPRVPGNDDVVNERASTTCQEFSVDEMNGLVSLVIQVAGHPERLLGYETSTEIWKQALSSISLLVMRDFSSIQSKLIDLQESMDAIAKATYEAFWKNQWDSQQIELTLSKQFSKGFMTPSQLASIRALPRPVRGCRCGASDHEYVNSQRCILYHELRLLDEEQLTEQSLKKTVVDTSLKGLNAVETAFKDRLIKAKETQANEIAEATFVNEMEKLQVKKQKRAIFAPNFSTIVLCAVAAVSDALKSSLKSTSKIGSVGEIGVEHLGHDDEVLTLQSLGKRPALEERVCSPSKKARNEPDDHQLQGFDPSFLAHVLTYISRTWGHVYREPTHDEFSWRWEVHHGQTLEAQSRERKACKNPRTPGSLTFEHMEFAVKTMSFACIEGHSMTEGREKSGAEDLVRLGYLVSPTKTGLLDELKALHQLSIITINSEHGTAFLPDEWYSRVDPLILNDMHSKWSFSADPDNKHLIHPKVRHGLANYWIRLDDDAAWALNEDPNEVVFADDEWDEWRRSFEADNTNLMDNEDGIGKFGF